MSKKKAAKKVVSFNLRKSTIMMMKAFAKLEGRSLSSFVDRKLRGST